MPKGIKGFQKGHSGFEGKHFSEKSKKLSIESHKGQIPWIKGVKMPPRSKKWCNNISKSCKGEKFPNRKSPSPFTETHRRNMSDVRKGKNGSNWKGGITPENQKLRSSIEYHLWRESVFARDNWTDQKTGIKGGKLHPHHILNFSQYPELRFAIDNGITLSKESHKEFHKRYGNRNNTKEQIIEFFGIIKI